MSKVYVFLADGFEDIEGLTVVDLMRRADIDIKTVSIKKSKEITTSHGITMLTDLTFAETDFTDADMLVLPGGMPGTINLGESDAVRKAILAMNDAGKIVAAVCAAPGVLGKYGLLEGKTACSFPQHEKNLIGATVVREPVVVDGNIVTSRGLGTTMDFGLKLLELLEGKEKSDEIAHKTVYREKN